MIEEVSYLFAMSVCIFVFVSSRLTHIVYIYESTQLCLYHLFNFISIAGYDIYIK